jgi:Tfp pilus assembly protein PilF
MAAAFEDLALATEWINAGRFQQAEQVCWQVLRADALCVEAWCLLGVVALGTGDCAAALVRTDRALQLDPNSARALHIRGLTYKRLGRQGEAIDCFQRAISAAPDFSDPYVSLGNVLADKQLPSEAERCYRRALELQPRSPELWCNLGNLFQDHRRFGVAAACYWRALECEPKFADAYYSLGLVLKAQGHLQEAASCFTRAAELCPDFALAHLGIAHVHLIQGDFGQGWQEYEWRFETGQMEQRHFVAPRWNGEPLGGKTILLWAEQGLGDTIQFVRFARSVQRLGATVVVECQRRLYSILGRCAGIDRLVACGDALPQFHFHCPLLSVPRVLGTTLDDIPAQGPYLFADPGLIALWAEKLRELKGFRVGVNWRGRRGLATAEQRDVPPHCFDSICRCPGTHVISLQRGAARRDLLDSEGRSLLLDPGEHVDTVHGPFMDTAAIMRNLDLVITSDTSIAHLAGALGVPVWVALPCDPDWRWLVDRTDSPWYPTMRLFRQRQDRDWGKVFAEIEFALHKFVAVHTSRS